MGNEFDDSEWRDAVVSTLKGTDSSKANLKDLRRLVLISLQCDESDKSAKKHYKRTIKLLEEEGTLTLDADGKVKLKKKKKRKSDKDTSDEKKKKKQKKTEQTEEGEHDQQEQSSEEKKSTNQESNTHQAPAADKNKPCKGNPQGVTRLFLGNLPFAVDEASLGDFFPGQVTHIKWITDKETGKFYGSAFCEMDTSGKRGSGCSNGRKSADGATNQGKLCACP